MSEEMIKIVGARQHNLKSLSVNIPRNQLVVVTGLSGSGKSSLAFDTLYAEGQRRYVESLSAYARMFLDQLQKPDVEHIEGLSPAIAIEQRSGAANPRSIVATTTEIYDYLRLLFAHIGEAHCPECKEKIYRQSPQQIVEKLMQIPENAKFMILTPYVSGRKGEHREQLEKMRKDGFVRARIDGKICSLDSEITLAKTHKHTLEAIVDRLVGGRCTTSRLTDSVELALRLGNGVMTVLIEDAELAGGWREEKMSEHFACLKCGISLEELHPRMFSFNNPYGACPACHGIGSRLVFREDLVISHPELSLKKGAAPLWRRGGMRLIQYYNFLLKRVAEHYGFKETTAWNKLEPRIQKILLWGSGDEEICFDYYLRGKLHHMTKPFEGIIPMLARRYEESESEEVRERLRPAMVFSECEVCHGARLKPEILSVTIDELSIIDFCRLSVEQAYQFVLRLETTLSPMKLDISREILKEIRQRLMFLQEVGLGYLTLNRHSGSLSGGEAQRIRLATQVGSGLVGVMYILDEPSIGLHQRDNAKLLATLKKLRDYGNTVIVVEHDLDTIREADFLVDLGPGAGRLGGELVYAGPPNKIVNCTNSFTGKFLSGEMEIALPVERNKGNGQAIRIVGATQNNLKNVSVDIPLGLLCCVTGVSGSGKSSLIREVLMKSIQAKQGIKGVDPGKCKEIRGLEHIDKMIVIDQSPIGRTPRSNPATYTDAFGEIRNLFAKTPDARAKGYTPGRFSFNVKGGRCEACSGDGIRKIEMQFLPDVFVKCDTCNGMRYNDETLTVRYKGKSIAEVLEMTIEEACEFFENIPKLKRILGTLNAVGLGYLQLGQPATTLSGGEAQRVKLATELARRPTGHTLYILDEPTTGLHMADIKQLLEVLISLREQGNSVLVIEHNLDVIKVADYLIDLGPDGGDKGGEIVAVGTPEEVAANPESITGQFLIPLLGEILPKKSRTNRKKKKQSEDKKL